MTLNDNTYPVSKVSKAWVIFSETAAETAVYLESHLVATPPQPATYEPKPQVQ